MLHTCRLILSVSALLLICLTHAEAKEAFVAMPSPCYSVEAIKKNKVYLKEDDQACVQVMPKTIIELDETVDVIEVYVQGRLWNTQSLDKKDIDPEKIAAAVEEQKKKLETGILIRQDEKAAKRAEEAAKAFYSEKYQSILKREQERIKTEVFKMGDQEKNEIYADATGNHPHGLLNKDSNLYIFISSSMPKNTLRAYARDVAALKEKNVMMVIRGMIGSPPGIKETARYLKKLIQKDPDCQRNCKVNKARFAIDPKLFEQYRITEVPAFVYDRNVKAISPDIGRKTENKSNSEFYKLSGDVSLEYALELFRRQTKEKELDHLIDRLRMNDDGIY